MRTLALVGVVIASIANTVRAEGDVRLAVSVGQSPRQGLADAAVTVVVFSDFGCGQCAALEPSLAALRELFPVKVAIVHRQFPLDDEWTLPAEAALAAAAQGRFVEMNARLFSARGQVDRVTVEAMARDLGLDMLTFRAALDGGTYRGQVVAERADGVSLGLRGTPAVFVNGRAAYGRPTLATLIDWVEAELDGRGRAVPVTTLADLPDPPHDPGVQMGEAYAVGLGLPGHVQGPDGAAVTIVEWIDYECGFCARQAPALRDLLAQRSDVRLVTRHLPLTMHPNAALAAEAAVEAGRQNKLAAFTEALFAQPGRAESHVRAAGSLAGLDVSQLDTALRTRRHRGAVVAEVRAATALGVMGTPTLFINGYPERGALSADRLANAVDIHAGISASALAGGMGPRDMYGLATSMAVRRELGDPERAPQLGELVLTMRPLERERAVAAACRRFDFVRANALASDLPAQAQARTAQICRAYGGDF